MRCSYVRARRTDPSLAGFASGSVDKRGAGLAVCLFFVGVWLTEVVRLAEGYSSAPLGRVTFGNCPKSNQKVLPLHTALRCASGSGAPSLLQGPAAKGHPWPIATLAASMPLYLLRNDYVQPPERGDWCRLSDFGLKTEKLRAVVFLI